MVKKERRELIATATLYMLLLTRHELGTERSDDPSISVAKESYLAKIGSFAEQTDR